MDVPVRAVIIVYVIVPRATFPSDQCYPFAAHHRDQENKFREYNQPVGDYQNELGQRHWHWLAKNQGFLKRYSVKAEKQA